MMLCFLFSALIVALDQFIKQWIVRTVEIGETGIELIPGVLGITHWENDGAMLNFLSGQQWLLAAIAFIASVVLVMILLRYNEGFWGTIGLAAVLGGTVGNLFDRIFNDGKVIDMFRTLFINFPIFNIADIFITLGFITFLVHFISLTVKAGKEVSAGKTGKAVTDSGNTGVSASPDSRFDEAEDDADVQRLTGIDELYSAKNLMQEKPVSPAVAQPVISAQPAGDTQSAPVMQEPVAATQQAVPPVPVAAEPVAARPHTPSRAPVVKLRDPQAVASPNSHVSQAHPADIPVDEIDAFTSHYDSTTDTTPEISLTLEALEAELGSSLDTDYDIDELLREYGIDDDLGV